MADPGLPDYKALYEKAKDDQTRAEEQRRQAEEQQRQAEEQRRQAEEQLQHEAGLRRQAEERTQLTTFDEYIVACHTLLSAPLQVAHPSQSTKGSIPPPTGKYCPTKLCKWIDFPAQQAEVYNTVRQYLQPPDADAPRLFSPLISLEELGRAICQRPISSEKDLEGVERFGKDHHIHEIVSALCQIQSAREELGLGHGFRFDSHRNALHEEAADAREADAAFGRMQPDQFCVHRLSGESSTLLMTVEYKPPHKLSVENLCAGLRSMNFWEEVVNSETIPTDAAEKLRYNATRLTGAALVQEYHVMIQEGLAYSCLSTGIALVFLYVPEDEPTTLHYYLCVPNKDVLSDVEGCYQKPVTAVARLLCLSLMSCGTSLRSNAWRNMAKQNLHTWATNFEHTRSQIPTEQLHETPPGSEYVPSSPIEVPEEGRNRRNTRSNTCCTSSPVTLDRNDHSESSDSESNVAAPVRKRNYSQVASSPPQPQVRRSWPSQRGGGGQSQHASSAFCTQECLLGLQQGGLLDDACPNVLEHCKGQQTDKHLITATRLVNLLKEQLDIDVDHSCEPFGTCGASGAPFRIRCDSHGYTVVGKGTTSRLWGTVSREADFYHILRSVQGSAIPVFLGSIDLKQTYFLHGAGEIQHMLLMGWGGEPLTDAQMEAMSSAIRQSNVEICKLGVRHGDLRAENMLWNSMLNRVLLIDFHKSVLFDMRVGLLKRKSGMEDAADARTARQRRLLT